VIWWGIGAALLAAAALGVYFAFQSPTFVAGLTAAAAAAAWKAVAPAVVKRMDPAAEAAWRRAIRRGTDDEWRRKRRGAPPKG